MPYYRVIIWVKNKQTLDIHQGIRQLDVSDIEIASRMMWKKAIQHYGEHWVEDVEVQMLSKTCRAVNKHLQGLRKKKTQPTLPILNSNRNQRKGEAAIQSFLKRDNGDGRA